MKQLIAILISTTLTLSVSAESLKDALKAAKGGKYIAPSAAQVREAETLFIRTLKGEQSLDLQKAWQTQGFIMRTLRGSNLTIVQEINEKRTGRGFYLFRQHGGLPVALQAPHSFKDLYTRQITRQLMQEGNYIAAAWNTVPRYGKNKQDNFADMAHLEDTIFQAFGRAFVHQYPTGTIVQLHSFAQEKRKKNVGKTTDLILSNTTITPYQRVLNTNQCLKSKLTDFVVRLYPYEILELGGTSNSNAKDLRKRGFNHFIHIEMSKPLRQRLRKDKRLRGQFSACLQ
ncbi:hypothetical protein PN36_00450 [Candidatus Thiomargarita nelsonii]|uniref:Uncharacterized protein n=1 Tax=Candidatus Thiomargarita nelsonii TaxID=1003181 RepID=A0A0A6P3E3_9GAMM|nr:hypothetical protein PN36_00450 [Candidatus Thiomargarita nelsonii]